MQPSPQGRSVPNASIGSVPTAAYVNPAATHPHRAGGDFFKNLGPPIIQVLVKKITVNIYGGNVARRSGGANTYSAMKELFKRPSIPGMTPQTLMTRYSDAE
jgi:hypothetical protein